MSICWPYDTEWDRPEACDCYWTYPFQAETSCPETVFLVLILGGLRAIFLIVGGNFPAAIGINKAAAVCSALRNGAANRWKERRINLLKHSGSLLLHEEMDRDADSP